ncbi:MAG: Helix-turn-helix domain [Pseudomonadota bacterium]|jgi:excisionase family DNA binding protein
MGTDGSVLPEDQIGRQEAADMFGVTPQTIARWAKNGQIPSYTLPSGRYRFSRAELNETLTRNQMEPR